MKVLVSDFDDTLFNEQYYENVEEINRFVDIGNCFIIATGRNVNQLKRDLAKVDLKFHYLICNDGAIILDNDFNIIRRTDINSDVTLKILKELKKDSNIIEVLIDDGFNYFTDKIENTNAILGRYREPTKAFERIENLMEKFPDIKGYLSYNWINIINKNTSKGEAIKYLAEKLNLNKNQIYTVGDGINDVSMNEMFKGYYMEGISHPKLVSVSRGSVKSVKELIQLIK